MLCRVKGDFVTTFIFRKSVCWKDVFKVMILLAAYWAPIRLTFFLYLKGTVVVGYLAVSAGPTVNKESGL